MRQFRGGQSNPTFLLITPSRNYVLRRKPAGQLLASAHAVDREFRVISALNRTKSVPVGVPYALCMDDSVIGTPFYVMEYVAGRVFWDASFPEVPREDRPQYCDALVAALASVHRVDYRAARLEDFGKPNGYLLRQIARWARQYEEDKQFGRVPAMERLLEWLPAHAPNDSGVAIVHGDYRSDNVIFHPTQARVLAILDWELSTLGDPLADFAYHLMMYRMPSLGVSGLAGKDLSILGIPSERDYVEKYCLQVGRTSLPNLDFYLAFAMFRLAGIFHGICGRVTRGTAVGTRALEYSRHVATIAELAWKQAEKTEG